MAKCHPDRLHAAHGLCRSCYVTKWRLENPERYALQPSRQKMATCHPDKRELARGLCNTCYRREWRSDPEHREAERSYSREWQRRKAEQWTSYDRFLRILKRYGLTFDDYTKLVISQTGRCAACKVADPDLEIDHCHTRGPRHVRGLLCHNCNSALGHAKDDVERLRALIRYLLAVG